MMATRGKIAAGYCLCTALLAVHVLCVLVLAVHLTSVRMRIRDNATAAMRMMTNNMIIWSYDHRERIVKILTLIVIMVLAVGSIRGRADQWKCFQIGSPWSIMRSNSRPAVDQRSTGGRFAGQVLVFLPAWHHSLTKIK